jgi:hypothetical protein
MHRNGSRPPDCGRDLLRQLLLLLPGRARAEAPSPTAQFSCTLAEDGRRSQCCNEADTTWPPQSRCSVSWKAGKHGTLSIGIDCSRNWLTTRSRLARQHTMASLGLSPIVTHLSPIVTLS